MTEQKLDLKDWQNRKYVTRDKSFVRLACVDDRFIYGTRSVPKKCLPAVWSIEGFGVLDNMGSDEWLINAPEAPVFVPGWFWICDRPDNEEAVYFKKYYEHLVCRIPPPDVLEAMKTAVRFADDMLTALPNKDAALIEDINTACEFFALDQRNESG